LWNVIGALGAATAALAQEIASAITPLAVRDRFMGTSVTR
jgi:hypothetical protein